MNRRMLFAVAALTFASLGHSQATAPKITYTTVAVPVGRALVDLSKQAGVKLTASPVLAGEIVVISVKGASLDDVKIQIAKACSGKWEPVEGGEMLIPDVAQRRQEEQKERAEYAASIGKSLKQLVESLNPPKPDGKGQTSAEKAAEAEEMRQYAFMMGGGASGRAVIKLAQAIGANSFATIDPKARVVFATNPTRMQRPLPPVANQILSQLVSEYNTELVKKERVKADVTEVEDERTKKLREFMGAFEEEEKPIEGIPSKAILVCARPPLFGGLMLSLKVFNEKGKVIISGQQMLSAEGSMMEGIEDYDFGPDGLPREKPKAKVGVPNEKPIEFSASTKELMTMSNVMTMSRSTTKLSDELRAKLLSPDQYDPLSFSHSEALIATANQRGKQLVAVLPDRMDSFMGMMMPKSEAMTPSVYLGSIADSVTVNAEGPFMLVRPAKPAKSRQERFDRVALSMFLKAVEAKGSVLLDDLADYAQRSNSPMEDTGTMTYFMIFAPTSIQSGFGGQVSWDMLRFYGALSTLQKKNLADGGRLGFNQLSPPLAAAVRQMTFGPDGSLTAENPEAKKPAFELPEIFAEAMMRRFGGDYRTEPTEVMPNGLPAEGFIEMKLTLDKVAKPTGDIPAMFGNAVLGADELAMLKMFKDMPGMEQMSAMIPTIDEVRLGDRSIYSFKFTVAPGVTMSKSLNDDRISGKSPIVKMANLPAEFAKKIDERIAMFKKIPFFDPSFFQGTGGGTPPPAP